MKTSYGWIFFIFCSVQLFSQEVSLELRPELYEKYDYKAMLEMQATVERRGSGQEPSQTFSSFSADFGLVPTDQIGDIWKMELDIEDMYFLLEAPNRSLSYHMKHPKRNEYMDKVHTQMKKTFSKPIAFRVPRDNKLPAPLPFSRVDSVLDIPQLSNLPQLFESFFIPFSKNDGDMGWQIQKKVETDFGTLLLQYDLQPTAAASQNPEEVVLNISGKIKPLAPELKLDGGFRGVWKVDRTTGMTLHLKLSYNTIFQYPNITIYYQSSTVIKRKQR